MENRELESLTSAVRSQRSTNWANSPDIDHNSIFEQKILGTGKGSRGKKSSGLPLENFKMKKVILRMITNGDTTLREWDNLYPVSRY